MEGGGSGFAKFTVPTLKAFLKVCSQERIWQWARICCSCYPMPKTAFFFNTFTIFWWAGKWCRKTFFPILHHFHPVILANTAVLAFVLLCNSKFSFHCYTQHEPTPTQKSTQKWQLWAFVTFCVKDYKGHSLVKTSLAKLPNTCVTSSCRKLGAECIASWGTVCNTNDMFVTPMTCL